MLRGVPASDPKHRKVLVRMAGTWAACPFGRHELRYFDGQEWTEHVSDAGRQSVDPIQIVPGQVEANIQPAVDPYAIGSTEVLWSGESQSMTAVMSGGRISVARYRLTRDALHFDVGTLSSRSEMIPIWGVVDVDVTQTITQRSRGVGDVRVHLDGQSTSRFGQGVVVLQSVANPQHVRGLILNQATSVRRAQQDFSHRREIEVRQAGAANHSISIAAMAPHAAGPAPSATALTAGPSLVEQLKDLAALRDAGVLTTEEFDQQKRSLLGA